MDLQTRLTHTPVGPALAAAAAICGCAFIYAADPTTPGGPIPVCPTKALFGFNCPGCGSMRMLYSLMHFDVPSALHYNALGLLGVVLVGWSFVAWALATVGRRIPRWEHAPGASYILGAALLLWFVLRLLPWEPFVNLQV
ncbi:DUF2752 domain-containing protein [Corynebacterium kozikiae]|uniref:DUF2752 domain-containing protein n=1 Tax=Corynebacterium kozikiae TaxID=2968469 RepID=UPI00211B7594|nr:DUF2752 domain-containing protein [Corynebacterium sp. 76QC2CO]